MTISDENDNDFFSVWIGVQHLVDVQENIHEVCATAGPDLIDTIFVILKTTGVKGIDLVVVKDGGELLEGPILCLEVLLADHLCTQLEGNSRSA